MKNLDVSVPSVHLNGTSRDALQEFHSHARSQLRKAIDAVTEAAPNARDFYPQGPDAFSKARAEHESRIARLTSVLRELDEIQISIED